MEINWDLNGKDLNIGLSGKLDTLSAMGLDDRFAELPAEVINIFFDLNGLDYIASAGLRVLYWAQEYTEDKGGRMVVRNISAEVLEILETTGFRDYINIE